MSLVLPSEKRSGKNWRFRFSCLALHNQSTGNTWKKERKKNPEDFSKRVSQIAAIRNSAMLSSPLLTYSQPKGLPEAQFLPQIYFHSWGTKMTEMQKEHYLKPQQNWEGSDIFQDTPAKAAHLSTAKRSATQLLQFLQFSSLHMEYFWPHWKWFQATFVKNRFKRIETFFLKVNTSQNPEEIPHLVITRLLYMHPIQLTPCCKQNQGPISLDSLSSSLGKKLSFTVSNKAVQPFQEQAASTAFPARDSKIHNTALAKAHFHLHEKPMRRDAITASLRNLHPAEEQSR